MASALYVIHMFDQALLLRYVMNVILAHSKANALYAVSLEYQMHIIVENVFNWKKWWQRFLERD